MPCQRCSNEGFILAYDVPATTLRATGDRLAIDSPTWNPVLTGTSTRADTLGIYVNNLEVWGDGVPLTVYPGATVAGIPRSPHQIWLWANFPQHFHLLDWWPVLLVDAHMSAGLTVAVGGGMIGSVLLLLAGAGACFRGERGARRAIASTGLTLSTFKGD